jgi:hypothetical protein
VRRAEASFFNLGGFMAKEQRSEKMAKKPKKDTSLPSTSTSGGLSERPTPPVTSVLPKGKLKNKPGA